MHIRFGYEIGISCQQPTPLLCLLSPRPELALRLVGQETFATSPAVPLAVFPDSFGNTCRSLVAPPGGITLRGSGVIADDGQPDAQAWNAAEMRLHDLPIDALQFLNASRYCESDLLSAFAWQQFGATPNGWPRVQAICDWVHRHIRFDYMQADVNRTAMGSWQQGVGVCRDYAHLMVALVRAMSIPARYVNGYLPDIGVPVTGPMDFCAWVEVYLGGAWHSFDPRNNTRRIGRFVVAQGRDAADVSLVQTFGPHTLTSFSVVCEEITEAA
jgi:transglutaminase-like putative cysteine protease